MIGPRSGQLLIMDKRQRQSWLKPDHETNQTTASRPASDQNNWTHQPKRRMGAKQNSIKLQKPTNLEQTNHRLENSSHPKERHKLFQSYRLQQHLYLLLIMVAIVRAVECIVVYQVKSTEMSSGRTDFAFAGETVTLSCDYTMKDEAEDVRQVIWSLNGKNFLRWRKNKQGLEVLSYTFKGHIHHTSRFNRLIIHNLTLSMHGKYACSVRTDLGTHVGEHDLVIISSQQCRFNDWRIHSEQTSCREVFRFDCRHMFPKPVQSCGLWDSKSNKFIRSVTVDISEESMPRNIETNVSHTNSPRETYRIRYSDIYTLKFANGSTNPQHLDLLKYAGHLEFRCNILVPETRWNVSLSHKMFEYQDGCNMDPLETVERMRLNFSQYAAQRMQQAGFLTSRPNQQQLEDIEMLTSSLKYDIIPPSHSITGDRNSLSVERTSTYQRNRNISGADLKSKAPHKLDNNLDLNCWQRPRVGSFARLSCAGQHTNQVRLIGANLLECRPNGWVPVRSSITNLGEPTTVRKQQAMNRKIAVLMSARRPTRAEKPDGQVLKPGPIDPHREEGSIDMDNDDDDSTGPSSDNRHKSSSSDIEGLTGRPNVRAGDSLEEKIRLENEILIRADDNDNLAPAELAALLPTCVSVATLKSKKQDRLPIIEASIVNSNGRLRSKDSRDQSDDEDWNWYIFASSSSDVAYSKVHVSSMVLMMSTIILLHLTICRH